jgi:hypothetical protein
VVLSDARVGEGDDVRRREMLVEGEGVCIWKGGSEGVPGVSESLAGSVREVRGACASWREYLHRISC